MAVNELRCHNPIQGLWWRIAQQNYPRYRIIEKVASFVYIGFIAKRWMWTERDRSTWKEWNEKRRLWLEKKTGAHWKQRHKIVSLRKQPTQWSPPLGRVRRETLPYWRGTERGSCIHRLAARTLMMWENSEENVSRPKKRLLFCVNCASLHKLIRYVQ